LSWLQNAPCKWVLRCVDYQIQFLATAAIRQCFARLASGLWNYLYILSAVISLPSSTMEDPQVTYYYNTFCVIRIIQLPRLWGLFLVQFFLISEPTFVKESLPTP
jgi:hypothetical protein